MLERFPLEPDSPIGGVVGTSPEAVIAIFGKVPDVERDNAQLKLLAQVNALVVEQPGRRIGFSYQNEGPNGHAVDPQPGCDE